MRILLSPGTYFYIIHCPIARELSSIAVKKTTLELASTTQYSYEFFILFRSYIPDSNNTIKSDTRNISEYYPERYPYEFANGVGTPPHTIVQMAIHP